MKIFDFCRKSALLSTMSLELLGKLPVIFLKKFSVKAILSDFHLMERPFRFLMKLPELIPIHLSDFHLMERPLKVLDKKSDKFLAMISVKFISMTSFKYLVVPTLKRSLILLAILSVGATQLDAQNRVRDLGIHPGILTPGTWNAITDVEGVLVGHQTILAGDSIRTGVTVILPHDGNLYRDRVPAAVYVGNGYGKAVGFTQVQELGELETPVGLTNTLGVYQVAHGIADYVLGLPGNEGVRSVNAVVGETNDGWLNDIRARVVGVSDVYAAIDAAKSGPVAEGNVGAGTGTRALGFKAGIGTASRVIPSERGGYTVGVLVQSNFGGILSVSGAPVGVELRNHYMVDEVPYEVSPRGHMEGRRMDGVGDGSGYAKVGPQVASKSVPYDFDVDGSIMIIVATDAPLSARNLERLAKRAFLGIAHVGGFASNGSGDYVIAFSTHPDVRRNLDAGSDVISVADLSNAAISPLFLAAIEATEEAILNSLFMSVDMQGVGGREMKALPVDHVMEIMKKYGVVKE
jgi:D-aminopeptidase